MNLHFVKKQIDDPVTKATGDFKFPIRSHIETQTGYSNSFIPTSFWLMYATSFGIKGHSENHQATHYLDAATTANARFSQSKHRLKPVEVAVEAHHDEPEDVPIHLIGNMPQFYRIAAAYVVIDAIDHLLSADLNVDVSRYLMLRSDTGDLMFKPVRKHYESKADAHPEQKLIVHPRDLINKLDDFYGDFSISQGNVQYFYERLVRRWQRIPAMLDLPDIIYDQRWISSSPEGKRLIEDEKKYIRSTVQAFIEETKKRIELGSILQAADIETLVKREYERIKSLVAEPEKLEQVDPKLVLPSQPELSLRVRKTLYLHYIRGMMDAVIKDAEAYAASHSNGETNLDDNYLYPALGKFSDARDTATKMGPNMNNIISQFRKHRIILEEGANTARILRQMQLPYDRWFGAMNFLYNGHVKEINRLLEHYDKGQGEQTQLKDDYDMFFHMHTLMTKFKPTKGLKPPMNLAQRIKSIGSSAAALLA